MTKVKIGKTKVYIIGPVRNNPLWQEQFQAAVNALDPDYYEVLSPLDYPGGVSEKSYMRLSCESVLWADVIHVLPGYKNSLGSLAEIAMAKSVGTMVTYH